MLTVDNPPAGKEWSLTVPQGSEGAWFRPLSVLARLLTSAVAGTRAPSLVYAKGDYIYAMTGVAAQAAGVDSLISLQNIGVVRLATTTAPVLQVVTGPLSPDILVEPGDRIGSLTPNVFDVADQYSNITVVLEEWVFVPAVDAITGELSRLTREVSGLCERLDALTGLMGGGQVGYPLPTKGGNE